MNIHLMLILLAFQSRPDAIAARMAAKAPPPSILGLNVASTRIITAGIKEAAK